MGRTSWPAIAGLVALGIVPALAGVARLAELALGADVTRRSSGGPAVAVGGV